MIKDLNNACFPNRARLKVFHTVLSGQVYCFYLGNWIAHLLRLFLVRASLDTSVVLLLKNVNFIANENFDRDFAGSLALSDPLFDAFESWALGHVE